MYWRAFCDVCVDSGKKKRKAKTAASPDVVKKSVSKGAKKQKLGHSGKKSSSSSSSYVPKSSKAAPNSPGNFFFVKILWVVNRFLKTAEVDYVFCDAFLLIIVLILFSGLFSNTLPTGF